ncbi:thiopeptide-type bacteriocin biosynthesis protein [Aquimarina rhabdastrellae]
MKRSFFLGSEWLYYKIYSGPITSDIILKDHLYPLAKDALNSNLISKWFFIRYKDDDLHIRVRFRLIDIKNIGVLIDKIHTTLAPLLENNLISKITNDTYHRELERYGTTCIEHTETLFSHNSNIILWMLSNINPEHQWIYGMRVVDTILDLFEYNPEEKKEFIGMLNHYFGQEFNVDKWKKKHLSSKYRQHKKLIEQAFNQKGHTTAFEEVLTHFKNSCSDTVQQILALLERDKLEVDNYLASLVHMHCNRLFRSNQRLNEWFFHDLLFQYYRSHLARQKSKQKLNA